MLVYNIYEYVLLNFFYYILLQLYEHKAVECKLNRSNYKLFLKARLQKVYRRFWTILKLIPI